MDNLLPGYRFYPTEEELVSFYLHYKLENTSEDLNRAMDRVIPILDIYSINPSDLPHYAGDRCRGDPEQWFFFIPRKESEARGGRPKRLTDSGYWKATGSPGYVYSSNHRIIGVKRTMVFYEGRAPSGTKTEWKMNEYKSIEGGELSTTADTTCALAPPKLRQEFSLCRIYKKSKSMRAFDRRPLTVSRPAIMQASQISGDHHDQLNQFQSQTMEALAGSSTAGVHAMDDELVWDLEDFWDYDI